MFIPRLNIGASFRNGNLHRKDHGVAVNDGHIPLYQYQLDTAIYNKSFQFPGLGVNKKIRLQKTKGDSLHSALKPVIILAKYLALFPVLGVSSEDASGLHFSWLSFSMVYSLALVVFLLFVNILFILHAIKTGITYHSTVEFTFLISVICNYVLFIQLAVKWPKFAREWEKLEKYTNSLGYTSRMAKQIRLITFIIMVFALSTVEHVSAVATNLFDAFQCITAGMTILQAYFIYNFPYIFVVLGYNTILAVIVFGLTFLASCAWNFMDIFIIVMSLAMSDHYKQFNRTLQAVNGKVMPSSFWRTMRETFNEISCITKLLDELLSPIVLLSFANNLYFICLQLLNSLKPMASTWHAAHFIYSFTYLIVRTILLSLCAATIYDQSKQPKTVLFCVPSESYCSEVARLLNQVTFDELALTGCRFFSVTRTLVLTVAGTIVTYEIVLVQFNAVSTDTKKNSTISCYNYFN